MADVKINLEAVHKEFLASLTAVSKSAQTLVADLQKLSDTHSKVASTANQSGVASAKAASAMSQVAASSQKAAQSQNAVVSGITNTIAAWYLLINTLSAVKNAMEDTVKAAIQNIDDFKGSTIGASAAITNFTNRSLQFGASWHDVFLRNLKETQIVFVELENLSAKYFASGTDLQLAYNALAQRGVILRKTELQQLAQLTDLILLLTQGQQSSIQVQEEIRSLINGTIRPTAQLAQLIKSFGLNVKDVAAEIKATQSLRPLEGILIGAQQATTEIQKTFKAAQNGLEVILRQLGRAGGDAFYAQIVGSLQRFTQFLKDNEPQIVTFFSIVGKLVSDTINWFEKLAEQLIKGSANGKDFIHPWINIIAVFQETIRVTANLVKVLLLLLRDIPLITETLAKAALPGSGVGFFSGVGKALKLLSDDLSKLDIGDPYLRVKQAADSMQRAVNEGLAALKKLRAAESEGFQPTVQHFKPDQQQQEEFQHIANAAREAARRRAASERIVSNVVSSGEIDRSLHALRRDLVFIEEGFDTMSNGVLGSLRTVANDVQKFLGENTLAVVRGLTTDVTKLYESIAETVTRTFNNTNKNLQDQLLRVQEGLVSFAAQAEESRIGRARAEVDPTVIARQKKLDEANHEFEVIKNALDREIARAEKFFEFATGKKHGRETGISPTSLANDIKKTGEEIRRTTQEVTDMETELRLLGAEAKVTGQDINTFLEERGATKKQEFLEASRKNLQLLQKEFETLIEIQNASGKSLDVLAKKYEVDLLAVRGTQAGTLARETEKLAFIQKEADLLNIKAIQDDLAVKNKRDADIATETNKLLEERLRILQQIQALQAHVAKGVLESAAEATGLKLKAAEGQPRTELQKAREPVEQDRIKFQAGIAERQAGIDQLLGASKALIEVDRGMSDELFLQAKAYQTALDASRAVGDAATRAQRLIVDLATSLTALGNAVDSTLTALADALLNSFEGKKTDFIRAFKDIADNLFKDSLKDVFSSLKTSLSTGFKDLVSSIAPSMASTLGPAFVAGFALIASFVLGQLLSGNKASASPGGATVGIQSSEQVRGLIGGETQIPIGLVGESLQNALVPTNVLLQRIAFGVERFSLGGISSSAIEAVVSQSISESLQIQLASH